MTEHAYTALPAAGTLEGIPEVSPSCPAPFYAGIPSGIFGTVGWPFSFLPSVFFCLFFVSVLGKLLNDFLDFLLMNG